MIWFDGQLTEAATIDATSAGALLGWGVFTTIAIRGGRPLFWPHHAARLERDAAAARVDLPWNAAKLRAGLDELIARENIANGVARISGVRRGDGRWNVAQGGALVDTRAPGGADDERAVALASFAVSDGGARASGGR